jgi:hypothetical protein
VAAGDTVLETALIHRVRAVGSQRGATRSAQGEYERVPVTGPWIPARVMERGGSAAKARGPATESRVARGYELLIAGEDELGVLVARPTASTVFESDCPVLGDPVIELNGEPEVLNNGEELIGFLCYGDVPLERS